MPRRSPLLCSVFGLAAIGLGLVGVPTLPAQPKPAAPAIPPAYPTLTSPASLGIKPGTSTDLALTGTNLLEATAVWTSFPAKVTIAPGQKDAAKLTAKVEVGADVGPGLHFLRVATNSGVSNVRPICVDDLPEVAETDKNRAKATPQVIPVPCVVAGKIEPEAADFFKFPVQPGKPITVEVLARRIGSPLDPVVILYDGNGKELGGVYADDTPGLQSDARLTFTPKQPGEIIVEVRDTTYRGGADFAYRLRVGNFPGATTAYPLFVQRGQKAEINFTGPNIDGVKPVTVTASTDPTVEVIAVAPKRAEGPAGWPVPVRLSNMPELVEQEPNNEPAKATVIPVPGGVSARFLEKNDIDHFRFTGKKGTKYVIQAEAYELNSPAEVYFRVLDAKGAELAKSNPQQPSARVEFTPAADGEFVIACEHLNYLAGPSEVYHLSVQPALPDFNLTVALDRLDIPAGGIGLVPIVGLGKLNGFAGAVDVSIVGEGLSGSVTLPAGANPLPAAPTYLPITAAADAKPGFRLARVKATAKIDGKDVVHYGSVFEVAKAAMANVTNPPTELTSAIAVALLPEQPVKIDVKFDKAEIAAGGTLKGKVTAKRGEKATEEIALVLLAVSPNVTPKLVPIPKGQPEAALELTTAANAAPGQAELLFRATTKVNGKDVGVNVKTPFTITVPPKKDEKKDEKKDKAPPPKK